MSPALGHESLGDRAGPAPSALTSFIETSHTTKSFQTHEPYYHHLASQILHNLQYQHDWTSLRLHTHSHPPSSNSRLLPRPLISGLPPQRIYIHPDEQVELLKQEKARRDEKDVSDERKGAEDRVKEREWVLPTHLREKWSLRRFAEVFDAIGDVPPEPEEDGHAITVEDGAADDSGEQNGEAKKRKSGKRVLLATVDTDSTIVYYIVHEGIVKPRQN
ncbi:hypothetical protein MMC16_005712 [Acarospora aff. strigata]|nr:hypothetical protein [Acarospora aff. strigata]